MLVRCVERKVGRASHPLFEGREGLASWVNREKDPLVQIAVRGMALPRLWSAGRTMRNGEAAQSLRFHSQEIEEQVAQVQIVTRMTSAHGFTAVHKVIWHRGDPGFFVDASVENHGDQPLEVEMLSSFSLAGISPFAADDAPGRLRLHRFRSAWSNEARHVAEDFEDLHLERNWGGGVNTLGFGQTGSLPVRGFHPFVAVEDKVARVFWGAHLAWHGSWQIEVYRRDDAVCLSGGLADFQRGHWMKRLAPGESFAAPSALVAACTGDLDDFCHRLVALQERLAHPEPAHDHDFPPIYNDWCSTWGKPSHEGILRSAERLQGVGIRYIVIDDGWAEKPEGEDIQFNGDWNVNTKAFPGGLAPTCAALRERGFIPGLWFEFEPCTQCTEAFAMTDHQLHLHGKVLQVGNRHFWDFRDPWTSGYLGDKVIRQLRESGFGYLKVDYNETIGLGCDGAESPGEGLRQHLVKVREFFERIRREIPGIIVENCASGGHRIEPGMVGITSLSQFSDAHETVEIPLIAAQMHRLIPAHKIQVWAVLRVDDTPHRLRYSLAATMLGRICISGDILRLDDWQMALLRECCAFHARAVPVIRDGHSRLHAHTGSSRRYPSGWQALMRSTGQSAMIVLHTFEGARPDEPMRVPLPDAGHWSLAAAFAAESGAYVMDGELVVPPLPDFTGCAWLLETSQMKPAISA